jgi:hypothetical protein
MCTSSVHGRWYARCVTVKERRDVDAQNACSHRLIAHLIAHYMASSVMMLVAVRLVAHQVAVVINHLLVCTRYRVSPLKATTWSGAVGHDKASDLAAIVTQQLLADTSNYLNQLRMTIWMECLRPYTATNSLRRNLPQSLTLVVTDYVQ